MFKTHYERTYDFSHKYKDYASNLLDKYGIKAYYRIIDEMRGSGDLAHLQNGSADVDIADRKYPQIIASLNLAMMERAFKQVPDPFAFHVVANTREQLEFYDLCVRSYKLNNPDADVRPYYSMMLTSVIQTWTHLIHERSGHKVYEVSAGLAERLVHTELRGLMSDDLKLPFKSVYVCIPESERVSLKLYNEESGWHNLEGFFLTEDLTGNDPSNPVRTWRFMFCGSPKDPNMILDDALFHFSVALPDSTPLVDILDNEQGLVDNSKLIHDETARAIFRKEWRKLFDWAMNVVMYTTWPDIEVEHFIANDEARALWNRIRKLPKGKKRENLKERYKQFLPSERIRLGRSVPLLTDQTDVTEPESQTDGSSERPLRRVRTLVSGFWMRQAYGEGRSLRKWRYQPPYWRNRDSTVESNPRHVLV